MNRIILALAALVGNASAFAPAVAPRPATQLQASKFDAGAKAAASLAASLALAGAVLTPEAAFAATATQAGGVCAAAPDSEVCRQSTQVKAKAAATAPVKKAAPAKASKPAAKKSSSKPKASKPKAVKKTKKAKKVRVAPRSPRSLCTLRRRLKRKCKRKKRYGYGAVLRSTFRASVARVAVRAVGLGPGPAELFDHELRWPRPCACQTYCREGGVPARSLDALVDLHRRPRRRARPRKQKLRLAPVSDRATARFQGLENHPP